MINFSKFAVLICLLSFCRPQCRKVFVTSSTHRGDLNGLAGADTICNNLANSSNAVSLIHDPVVNGLERYVAWLSTTSVNANDRITRTSSNCLVLSNNVSLTYDLNGLHDGSLNVNLSVDEAGKIVATSHVWTATDEMGRFAATLNNGLNCNNWLSASMNQTGIFGINTRSSRDWTFSSNESCDNENRLYCVSISLVVPTPPTMKPTTSLSTATATQTTSKTVTETTTTLFDSTTTSAPTSATKQYSALTVSTKPSIATAIQMLTNNDNQQVIIVVIALLGSILLLLLLGICLLVCYARNSNKKNTTVDEDADEMTTERNNPIPTTRINQHGNVDLVVNEPCYGETTLVKDL